MAAVKLPVISTVADSWRELIDDWRIFARLSTIPLALQVVGTALLALGAPADAPDGDEPRIGDALRTMLYLLCLWLLLVPAITAWHRHVLLGPGERADRPGYRFGRPEWIYVKKTFLVSALGSLIAVCVAIPVSIVAAVIGFGVGAIDAFGASVATTVMILVFLILIDWALVFPAAALDRPLRLGEARALGLGNRWRLAAVIVLAYLPQLVVSNVVGWLAVAALGDDPGSAAGRTIAMLAQAVVQYAFLAVTVGALSFSYLKLTTARG